MKSLYENHPFIAGILSLFSGLLITLATILLLDLFLPEAGTAFAYIVADIAIPAGIILAALCFIRVIKLEAKDAPRNLPKIGFCGMVIIMAPFFTITCATSLIKLLIKLL